MREYIIALRMKLPANVTPEQWVKRKIGSVNLAGVEVHYEEINNESETKSRSKPRSSNKTTGNSDKTQN